MLICDFIIFHNGIITLRGAFAPSFLFMDIFMDQITVKGGEIIKMLKLDNTKVGLRIYHNIYMLIVKLN